MTIFFKKVQDEKPEEVLKDTVVFACSEASCNGWMREEFATPDLKCPLCGNVTIQEVRELPQIS